MSHPPFEEASDEWSEWLLHRRHGDDPVRALQIGRIIDTYVDRVLDGAALSPGDRLLDVGTGTGAVAFRAIERVGPSLQVILSDVSRPMLDYAARDARDLGMRAQCRFLQAGADDLGAIPDASVDAVTTRSVLAYVSDKIAALKEFHRVLAPGGRLSIGEPVMRDDALDTITLRGIALGRAPDDAQQLASLVHRWRAAQFPDTPEKLATSPITNYGERDLFRFVREAGFSKVELELRIRSLPASSTSWDTFLKSAPHPWSPTLGSILRNDFLPHEQALLESLFRSGIETGTAESVDRMVYVTAVKAAAGK